MAGYTDIGLDTILKTGHSVVEPVDLRLFLLTPTSHYGQNIN